jgi:hypothetical protein
VEHAVVGSRKGKRSTVGDRTAAIGTDGRLDYLDEVRAANKSLVHFNVFHDSRRTLRMSIKSAGELKREWATAMANSVIVDLRAHMQNGKTFVCSSRGRLHADVKQVLIDADYCVEDFEDKYGDTQTRVSLPD